MNTVSVRGGLANRLRVLYAHYCAMVLLRSNSSLSLVWPLHPHCPQPFEDLFDPLVNLTTHTELADQYYRNVSSPPPTNVPLVRPERNCHVECSLKPNAALQERIDFNLRRLGHPFACLHIRRTDLKSELKKTQANPVSDGEFEIWTKAQNLSTFLATDNAQTQQHFMQLFGSIVTENIKDVHDLRKTSVATAVVDAWTCAHSSAFMGTPHSSFTNNIRSLRACHRHDHTGKQQVPSRGG